MQYYNGLPLRFGEGDGDTSRVGGWWCGTGEGDRILSETVSDGDATQVECRDVNVFIKVKGQGA